MNANVDTIINIMLGLKWLVKWIILNWNNKDFSFIKILIEEKLLIFPFMHFTMSIKAKKNKNKYLSLHNNFWRK